MKFVSNSKLLTAEDEHEFRVLAEELKIEYKQEQATREHLERARYLKKIIDGVLPAARDDSAYFWQSGEWLALDVKADRYTLKGDISRLPNWKADSAIHFRNGVYCRFSMLTSTALVEHRISYRDTSNLSLTNRRIRYDGALGSFSVPLQRVKQFRSYEDALILEKESGKVQLFAHSDDPYILSAVLDKLIENRLTDLANKKQIAAKRLLNAPPEKRIDIENILDAVGDEWLMLPHLTDKSADNLTVRVKGSRDYYQVNLTEYKCTCPDWVERRGSFLKRDARRACKHILKLLGSEWWDELYGLAKFWCFVSSNRGIPIWSHIAYYLVDNSPVVLIRQEGNSWVDVLAEARSQHKMRRYGRFGFNPEKTRWSHGEAPKNAMVLRKLIGNLCDPKNEI